MFLVAYVGGGYGTSARTAVAALLWLAVAAGLALRWLPRAPVPREAVAVGTLLASLAVLTLASVAWGASGETAFAEFVRVLLYLGIFAAAVVAATQADLARWVDGIAFAVVAVATVALASRFFPSLFPDRALETFLPTALARLSFPVDYWNGLAALIALAIPLLLSNGVAHRVVAVRSASVAALPLVAVAIYLTSSRAGSAAALLGGAGFVALSDRRWRAAGALAVGAAASAVAVAFVSTRDVLVNGPLDSTAAAAGGRQAAVVLAAAMLAAAVTWTVVPGWMAGRVTLPRRAGRAAVAVLTITVVGAVLATDPAQRVREFTATPTGIGQGESIETHLVSASGNWRWQYWQSSVEQFRENPWAGGGAGTFEAWWAQNGSTVAFVENPHSLYFQMLGELGLPGLVLVAAVLVVGLATGVRRTLHGRTRNATAALTAALAGFVLAAGLDWAWQLTIVTAVAMLLLGLVVGPATGSAAGGVSRRSRLVPAVAAVALVVAIVQAAAWATDNRLQASRDAAARGDRAAARDAANLARRLQPWSASPYTQLALVEEEAEHLGPARHWIGEALERDDRDWRLWLIAARIDTRAGNIARARRQLHHAERLNPRSPIFAEAGA